MWAKTRDILRRTWRQVYRSTIILAEKMPRDQREWELTDKETYQKIVIAAQERGIFKHEVIREPYFLSYSHSEADIDETLNIMSDVVHDVKYGRD